MRIHFCYIISKITDQCVDNEAVIKDIHDQPYWYFNYSHIIVNGQTSSSFNLYHDTHGDKPNTPETNPFNIDFGKCEKQLRLNLPADESLLITVIDYKDNIKESNRVYNVYTATGIQLDTSICDNVSVTYDYIIPHDSGIDFDIAKDILLKGFNVLDPTEPFFNDMYYPYISDDGFDIPISDRRTDVFQNITLCEPNCHLSDINYETNSRNVIANSVTIKSIYYFI